MAKFNVKKTAKKVAIVATLGVTGLIVLGAINVYRMNKGLETLNLDGENWWK